ncbi:MAG: alpha/beta fold hydrolase [Myxococcota bacterium]
MNTDTDWTFDGTWPHPPQWSATPDGRLHYVDLGPREAPPVVLLHGNPSWSYLYRALIGPLVADGRRVIAIDHLGFGRSDHPADPSVYAIDRHVARLAALLGSLGLDRVTLVVHDWGAPIGLAWAVDAPDRLAGLVVLNGFVRPPTVDAPLPMPLGLRMFRLPGVGELAVQGLHGLVRMFLFRAGRGDPRPLDPTAQRAYLAPNPTYGARAGQLAFARAFPATPAEPAAALLDRIHRGLPALRSVPTLLVWGERDAVFGPPTLSGWRADLPQAQVVTLPDAGHFALEDAPDAVVGAVQAFLRR